MSQTIHSSLQEERVFSPSAEFSSQAVVKESATYEALYERSISDPEGFWDEMAGSELSWSKRWTEVFRHDFTGIGATEGPYVSFFSGGELNVSYNCLDRHVEQGRGERVALFWQGEPESERRTLTYRELHREVCRFANALKSLGVTKGATVTICMPMVPELLIAVQACARLGAIHSVVFSAFSAESLRSRIQDCAASFVITADIGYHAGKVVELKSKVDLAIAECPTVTKVIVYNRGNTTVQMQPGRDIWWHDAISPCLEHCSAEPFPAETPLFILYTSGSTGKPKGVLHTSAGYLLQTHLTFKYYFDYRPADIFWCTADIGWITGHSYLAYGPLSNCATCVMYEGAPTFPAADRFWKIIEQYRVTIFYTAPTAIRMLMRLGDALPNSFDLSSLRLLGSVGEPINPEAWMWYHRVIGKERCPVIDTWWQTETGGVMISTLPGALAAKPGSAGRPFFGVAPKVLREDGSEAGVNEGGSLVLTRPWPGMLRGVFGDPRNEIIARTYFSKYPGLYFAGDGARVDAEGYFWLLGRIDDVLNVSAHRLSTAEIESALVAHPKVAEAAVVGFPHDTKGQGIHCFVVLKSGHASSSIFAAELKQHVRSQIGPIATPDRIQFGEGLPKTRSGKIMRRILRKIAEGCPDEVGDVSTLADPSVVSMLIEGQPQ
jgi:acetyl-CoA synthetase